MNPSCERTCGCKSLDPAVLGTGEIHQTDENCFISTYAVPQMDCPAEESMIRLALSGSASVRGLSFDLRQRQLTVFHDGPAEPISAQLATLGLGARLQETRSGGVDSPAAPPAPLALPGQEAQTLRLLLVINAVMFLIEIIMGLIAQSTGLMGDSLDMLADAAVYGVSLYAVGRGVQAQMGAARLAGWLQLLLAIGLLAEVVRRFTFGSEPQSLLMMTISLLALFANVACLLLIAKHRHAGAHMKASWIFSANDVLINLGVILAGVLVAWTDSPYPDLFIGSLIGLIVMNGARRILALKP